MATLNNELRAPKDEIFMYQETVQQLSNNTILLDFHETLKKLVEEGYQLTFIGLNHKSSDNNTRIKDVNHLKNYINNITGYKFIT